MSGKHLSERESVAVKILGRLIKAEQKHREEWNEDNEEILSYCRNGKNERFYQEYAGDAFLWAQVSKTSEALDIFVPSIYSQTPKTSITPRSHASEMSRVRGQLMQDYLDVSLKETDADWHYTKCAEWAVLTGRCVLWTGLDRRGLVCSKWVPTKDVGIDPDHDIPEQRSWIYRKRRPKRFELINKYPHEKSRLKETKSYKARRSDVESDAGSAQDHAHDIIETYEIYFRVGLANFKDGQDAEDPTEDSEVEYKDEPCKYILVCDGGDPKTGWLIRNPQKDEMGEPVLDEKMQPVFEYHHPWEIPFYRDGRWPCEIEDIRTDPETSLPCSVLKPGLGWQRCLNLLYTWAIGKSRTTLRDIIFFFEQGGIQLTEADKDEILNGSDLAVVMPRLKELAQGNQMAEKLVDVLQFPEMKQTHVDLIQMCEANFAKSTGLYELLYTGTTDTQIRTAADANMKDRNSRSRLEQDASKFEKFLSRVRRKEAFAARYLLDPQDAMAVLGQRASDWGELRSPQEFEQYELQLRKQMEQQLPLMIEQIMLEAQMAGMPMDPQMDPQMAQQQAFQMAEEQIQQALDQFGVRFESWLYEHDFEIEHGSARAKNTQWEIDSTEKVLQTALPAAMPVRPDVGITLIADMIKAIGREDTATMMYQVAQEMREQMMAPPPIEEEEPPEETE